MCSAIFFLCEVRSNESLLERTCLTMHVYNLYPEEGSIAETSFKTLLSVDLQRAYVAYGLLCSMIILFFFFTYLEIICMHISFSTCGEYYAKVDFKKLGFHRTYHAVATWVRLIEEQPRVSNASRSVVQGYRLHLFQAPRSEIVRPARRRKTGESRSGAAEPVSL